MKLLISLFFSLALCNLSFAEGKFNDGDDFRNTAAEYQAKAKNYGDKGNYEVAAHYQRLAEIKLAAAEKADQGKWNDIDWSEYEEINKKLSAAKGYKKKK